ncbi:TetR/AcrR family transcriptional regulator [Rathayibacter oskolensis]|uniref:TetR/AcrR family transcriptional regulator n=1 Tax=Rathayibacter oskolensis TaxID=1891671 RepID=UPI00265F69B7|nr:TetR/AcrR family transcriptional regulator [Rathayibacter oskolensis]WKK71081.1 TetR/AcrR family transcriptional regulator [Rathayibacter oskolensis]
MSGLTISDITDRAGVNRSTFYAHASSAAELLCAALNAELDAIRDDYLDTLRGGAATDPTIRQGTARILAHLELHRDLYMRAFDSPGGDSGLRAMLAVHFRAAVIATLETGTLDLPESEVLGTFLADGTASFPRGGLDRPHGGVAAPPRAPLPDTYLAAYRRLLPSWWPFATQG